MIQGGGKKDAFSPSVAIPYRLPQATVKLSPFLKFHFHKSSYLCSEITRVTAASHCSFSVFTSASIFVSSLHESSSILTLVCLFLFFFCLLLHFSSFHRKSQFFLLLLNLSSPSHCLFLFPVMLLHAFS